MGYNVGGKSKKGLSPLKGRGGAQKQGEDGEGVLLRYRGGIGVQNQGSVDRKEKGRAWGGCSFTGGKERSHVKGVKGVEGGQSKKRRGRTLSGEG